MGGGGKLVVVFIPTALCTWSGPVDYWSKRQQPSHDDLSKKAVVPKRFQDLDHLASRKTRSLTTFCCTACNQKKSNNLNYI